MSGPKVRAHLAEALSWSPQEPTAPLAIVAAALGMAAPVMLGFLAGAPQAGFAAALGALAVAPAEPGAKPGVHLRDAGLALAPTVLAVLLLIAAGESGPARSAVVVAAAALAALVSGYSRPMAVLATRFVVFLTIALAVPLGDVRQGLGTLALVIAGALWTSALSLAAALARPAPPVDAAPRRQASAQQKRARWTRTLSTLAGWSYTARLAIGLALAGLADHLVPGHHLHWTALTVALLTPRGDEVLSVRTTQRAMGTAIGVAATGLAWQAGLTAPLVVIALGLLAGLRAWLRPANYLAYSIVMTPLIMLIIDGGRPPEAGLLVDRLVATLIGALLVTALSAVMHALAPAAAGD